MLISSLVLSARTEKQESYTETFSTIGWWISGWNDKLCDKFCLLKKRMEIGDSFAFLCVQRPLTCDNRGQLSERLSIDATLSDMEAHDLHFSDQLFSSKQECESWQRGNSRYLAPSRNTRAFLHEWSIKDFINLIHSFFEVLRNYFLSAQVLTQLKLLSNQLW